MEFDAGREIDWGMAARDYAAHRPGPPPSFYQRLKDEGIGLPGQSILDLATGTGLLACEFAKQGAKVCGLDISGGQIEAARKMAAKDKLDIDFHASPAETVPLPDASIDAVTANQCWAYFDHARVLPELARVMRPGAKLAVSYFSFVPREDPIVAASEKLVLKFNPGWSGADWDGRAPAELPLAHPAFTSKTRFCYDEAIPFTRESWRGRMRALRGMGASLPPETVAKFDAEHEAILKQMAGESFTILHRIYAYIYERE